LNHTGLLVLPLNKGKLYAAFITRYWFDFGEIVLICAESSERDDMSHHPEVNMQLSLSLTFVTYVSSALFQF
jgi:hypothetical protein